MSDAIIARNFQQIAKDMNRLEAELKSLKQKVVNAPLVAGRRVHHTISSGIISVTAPNILLSSESGTEDTLHTINGFADGKAIIVRANEGHTITVQDFLNSPGGVGNINLRGTQDQVIGDIRDTMFFMYSEEISQWMQTDLDHFLNLSDAPDTYVGQAGKHVAVKATEDGVEFVDADSGGAETFIELTDTPDDYAGQIGKLVAVNGTEDGLVFTDPPSPPTPTFLDLTDTPDDYTGQASKAVKVKVDESGLEFVVDSVDAVSNIIYATESTSTNVDTGEDNLVSYTLAGGVLVISGQSMWWEAWGNFANNANTKTVRVYWGSVLILEAVTTIADEMFTIRGRVSRNVDGTQICACSFVSTSIQEVNTAHSAQNLSTDIEFRITGEATDTFDISISNAVIGLADDGTGGIVGPPGEPGEDAPDNFLDLTDTPNAYTGQATEVVRVNTGETALEFHPLTTDDIPEGLIVDRNYVSDAEKTKLSGIEALADVTDAVNVGSAIDGSAEQVSLSTTDRFALVVSGVLKWSTYTTLRDAIKGYYDSVSATLTNKSIDASTNTLTNINTSALANGAVSNAKLANINQYELKGRSSASAGAPENLTSSAFFFSLLTAASAAAFRTLTGAVGLTGNETIAGIKSFSDRANFDAALKTNGMYDFDYTTVTPAETKLKIGFSRSLATQQFQAVTLEVIMSCRVGTTVYMGMSTVIVQSRFSTTMVHGVGVQLAGLTVTEVTNTSVLKELEFTFTGISGTITEILVVSIRKGSLNPNITITYTMLP